MKNKHLYNGIQNIVKRIDEIQSFNKKQQQSILEFMENGKITLVASTTENPYYYVYKALLSRSTVFEFKLLEKEDIAIISDGDSHYDILSAIQKSIRGSDPQAAIHYLARLIKGEDLISICRRLLVIACEDIGLAYPNAITIAKSCVDAAMQIGFPEAKIPLAQATILLATSPKSNSAYLAIQNALDELDNEFIMDSVYYNPQENKIEQNIKAYLEYLKNI